MGFNLKYRHWNIITNMICMAPVMGRGHNAIRPEMLYTATWPWFMPYYLSSCGYIHQRLGDTLFHLAPFPVVLYCKNIPSFNHIGYVILVDFLFDFYSYEIWNMKWVEIRSEPKQIRTRPRSKFSTSKWMKIPSRHGRHNLHQYDNAIMNTIITCLIICKKEKKKSNQSWNFPFVFELLLSLKRRRNEEGVEVDVTNDETMPVFPFTKSFFHLLYSFL